MNQRLSQTGCTSGFRIVPKTIFVNGENPFHPYVPTGHVLGSRSYVPKVGRSDIETLSQKVRSWLWENENSTADDVAKQFDLSVERARGILNKQCNRGVTLVRHEKQPVGRRITRYSMRAVSTCAF